MCWSCNPYCGGCKPPKQKPIECPACGTYNNAKLSVCKKCGAQLPPPPKRPIVMCLYIGELCANPCDRHKKPSQDGTLKTCRWHTPVKSADEATD
jgi:hypothetical protein